MAKSANQMTVDVITTAVAKSGGALTVNPYSRTTWLYYLVSPICDAAAVIAANAERALFAGSHLGARGKYLDNACHEINVFRLKDETDDSLRRNAPRIFTPGATIDTDIDADEVTEENVQLDDIRPRSIVQLFTQMKGRLSKLLGVLTDMPFMMAEYWLGAAYLLREQDDHIVNIISDLITEDSEDIGDTTWCYEFCGYRAPGVQDVKVENSDYNEITIHLLIDEREGVDGRGRKLIYNESSIVTDVKALAEKYLPKPDYRTLKAPNLIVQSAIEKPVYIKGVVTFAGGLIVATVQDVEEAIEDYFYYNRRIGEPLTSAGIMAAVLAVPGVAGFTMGEPSESDLTPAAYEVSAIGNMEITT